MDIHNCRVGTVAGVKTKPGSLGLNALSAMQPAVTSALPIGSKVVSTKGHPGLVAAVFADGQWVRKFVDCPKCNRPTWEVETDEADFSQESGVQYLIVDGLGYWRVVDGGAVTLL
jgi:hypothetical protein